MTDRASSSRSVLTYNQSLLPRTDKSSCPPLTSLRNGFLTAPLPTPRCQAALLWVPRSFSEAPPIELLLRVGVRRESRWRRRGSKSSQCILVKNRGKLAQAHTPVWYPNPVVSDGCGTFPADFLQVRLFCWALGLKLLMYFLSSPDYLGASVARWFWVKIPRFFSKSLDFYPKKF